MALRSRAVSSRAASGWTSFLEHLHDHGYFSAQPEAADEEPAPAAAGSRFVRAFGSPGDHKRACLEFSRERESALLRLPQLPLRSLVASPVPQEALDSTFGGRKLVNASKRLRATLAVQPASRDCAVERYPHAAQGDASLSDAVRLMLCWATTSGVAPPSGLDELFTALTKLPAPPPGLRTLAEGEPSRLTANTAKLMQSEVWRSRESEATFERKRVDRREMSAPRFRPAGGALPLSVPKADGIGAERSDFGGWSQRPRSRETPRASEPLLRESWLEPDPRSPPPRWSDRSVEAAPPRRAVRNDRVFNSAAAQQRDSTLPPAQPQLEWPPPLSVPAQLPRASLDQPCPAQSWQPTRESEDVVLPPSRSAPVRKARRSLRALDDTL